MVVPVGQQEAGHSSQRITHISSFAPLISTVTSHVPPQLRLHRLSCGWIPQAARHAGARFIPLPALRLPGCLQNALLKTLTLSLTLLHDAPPTTVMEDATTSVMDSPTNARLYCVAMLPMHRKMPPASAKPTEAPLLCGVLQVALFCSGAGGKLPAGRF
jgi:hypothetical protein